MPTIREAASEFLANRRVAVTGVSREPQTHASNFVYRRLRERGYEAFAINRTQTRLKVMSAITTCARSLAASRRS